MKTGFWKTVYKTRVNTSLHNWGHVKGKVIAYVIRRCPTSARGNRRRARRPHSAFPLARRDHAPHTTHTSAPLAVLDVPPASSTLSARWAHHPTTRAPGSRRHRRHRAPPSYPRKIFPTCHRPSKKHRRRPSAADPHRAIPLPCLRASQGAFHSIAAAHLERWRPWRTSSARTATRKPESLPRRRSVLIVSAGGSQHGASESCYLDGSPARPRANPRATTSRLLVLASRTRPPRRRALPRITRPPIPRSVTSVASPGSQAIPSPLQIPRLRPHSRPCAAGPPPIAAQSATSPPADTFTTVFPPSARSSRPPICGHTRKSRQRRATSAIWPLPPT